MQIVLLKLMGRCFAGPPAIWNRKRYRHLAYIMYFCHETRHSPSEL